MSNLTNEQKAMYAILADNVYWDVRKGFTEVGGTDDFTNSNWTPVPDGWTVIDEISGSGVEGRVSHPQLEGFSARAFKNGNEIVIAYAGTDDKDKSGDMVVCRHDVVGIDKAARFRAKSKTQLFIQMCTVIRLALLGIYRATIRKKPDIPRKLYNHPGLTADT